MHDSRATFGESLAHAVQHRELSAHNADPDQPRSHVPVVDELIDGQARDELRLVVRTKSRMPAGGCTVTAVPLPTGSVLTASSIAGNARAQIADDRLHGWHSLWVWLEGHEAVPRRSPRCEQGAVPPVEGTDVKDVASGIRSDRLA